MLYNHPMKIESTNQTNIFQLFQTSNNNKNDDFLKLLEQNDYDKILEATLQNMSENEQKIHLEVLERLEKEGTNKDQLLLINIFAYAKDDIDLKQLDEKDKELIRTYENLFNELQKAIKENLEERLKFKKTQFELLHTDILLQKKESFNSKDGIL
jgi:ribosomal protein L18E